MRIGPSSAWAKTLGSFLAHVQDATDRVCVWGFERLKKAGAEPKVPERGNPYVVTAKRLGKGTLSFLGTLGDSYFKEYENLKKRRS